MKLRIRIIYLTFRDFLQNLKIVSESLNCDSLKIEKRTVSNVTATGAFVKPLPDSEIGNSPYDAIVHTNLLFFLFYDFQCFLNLIVLIIAVCLILFTEEFVFQLHIRFDTDILYAGTTRCKITICRDFKSTSVFQGTNCLYDTFSICRGSDDSSGSPILNRTGKYFRCTGTLSVYENDKRKIQRFLIAGEIFFFLSFLSSV